ncbi:MAG: tripartite tricarboxylate transporter substrate-binding protein [Pseudomonadota bacterium]
MSLAVWAGLLALVTGPAAWAGTYPEREITLILPFATGGTTDIVATTVAPLLEKELGQKIKILSRSGQGGVTGTLELLKAPSDGYTLGMATVSTTATNPAINKALKYDPLVDLTPIINIVATPNVLAVHPLFKADNFKQFLEELQRKPGKYSYASTGSGGIAHLQMEIFKSLTKTDIVHIAFRGASPAIGDVLNGQVMVLLDNLPSSMVYLKSGRLRPLAVAAPKRLAEFPEVPTFKELGLDSVNRSAYYGLVGPKDLPKEVVRRLNAAMTEVLKHPDVRKKLLAHGAFILGGSPEDFHRQIADELAYYKREIEGLGLKFEAGVIN